MITYKKHSSYKSMPWKNGGGVTSQIAIHPETANFPDDDFLWRLSSAKISAKNNFSQFNGYDRVLFVISGEGLLLNNFKLLPLTAFSFKGETPIECQLINDEVIDLGIIYKRGKVKVETSVLTLSVATATEVH